MCVPSGAEENTCVLIFEVSRRQDALTCRLFAQSCIQGISVLPRNERSKTFRNILLTRFPLRKVSVSVTLFLKLCKKQITHSCAEGVERPKWFRCLSLENNPGSDQGTSFILVFEDKKQNIIGKTKNVSWDKWLTVGHLGPGSNSCLHLTGSFL